MTPSRVEPTYDITYEYRADFDGHEFAGHVVASSIIEAATILQDKPSYGSLVDVRYLAEVKRTTCCQRGDWHGADHQPSDAELHVPHTSRYRFANDTLTVFLPEPNKAVYRWQCEYCGRVGTEAELNGA